MNKTLIMLFVAIFSTLGSYIAVLFHQSLLGGWSILGGFLGGLFGIWLGVWASKRYGD